MTGRTRRLARAIRRHEAAKLRGIGSRRRPVLVSGGSSADRDRLWRRLRRMPRNAVVVLPPGISMELLRVGR